MTIQKLTTFDPITDDSLNSYITSLRHSLPSDSFITCSHPLFCVYKQSPCMPVWKDMRISRGYKIVKLWIKKKL